MSESSAPYVDASDKNILFDTKINTIAFGIAKIYWFEYSKRTIAFFRRLHRSLQITPYLHTLPITVLVRCQHYMERQRELPQLKFQFK